MRVRLLTATLELVEIIDIIPFITPPEVIAWGARTFLKLERAGIDDTGAIRYREVCVYVAPTLSIR